MFEVEYTYENDEFEINGALLCVALTLHVSADLDDGDVQSVALESVRTKDDKAAPVWLSDAIGVWTRNNQDTLRDAYDTETASQFVRIASLRCVA